MTEIVKIGLNIPFQSVEAKIIYFNENGCLEPRLSMTFSPNKIPIYSKGLYTIYASKDGIDECLYVGESDYCVNQRIRRFFKELTGCTNPNETHPAASKAKNDGYSLESHTFKVKWIPWETIIAVAEKINTKTNYYDLMCNLDSAVSYFVKSKYNYTTYMMYGYSHATLKDFLEA
jgi:hypothetical protein